MATLALLAGCAAAPEGPVPIARGTACHVCGMGIQNLRYAGERTAADGMHMYDSVECFARDTAAEGPAWLSDYDSQALHAVDSMWIVRGDIPSPMGGGLAAFLDRSAADDVAGTVGGSVLPGHTLLHPDAGGTP
jgi:nitrous oxide reductase accessory protein NosL